MGLRWYEKYLLRVAAPWCARGTPGVLASVGLCVLCLVLAGAALVFGLPVAVVLLPLLVGVVLNVALVGAALLPAEGTVRSSLLYLAVQQPTLLLAVSPLASYPAPALWALAQLAACAPAYLAYPAHVSWERAMGGQVAVLRVFVGYLRDEWPVLDWEAAERATGSPSDAAPFLMVEGSVARHGYDGY